MVHIHLNLDFDTRYKLDPKIENNQHSISTGHYGINEIGTFTKPEKPIKNLQEGNYSWRVRAIDYGLMPSEWSSADLFLH